MIAWRRTEPRTARPFFAVSSLQDAFDNTGLVIGDQEEAIFDDSIQLDPADFDGLELAILPNLDTAKIKEVLGVKAASYSFVISLRDPMFKRRKIQEKWSLDGSIPSRIPLPQEIVGDFGHKREIDVTMSLVLNKPLDFEPGWPSHMGSWIAKRTFKLKLKSIRSTFDLRPMSKVEAKAFTGSAGALLHAEVEADLLATELEEGQTFATVYIAEEIYEAMQRATDGPLVQTLVMSEIVASVLADAAQEISEMTSAPKGAPIHTILEQLGQNQTMPLDELKKVVTDPIKLRALVHDRTEFVKHLRSV